MTCIPELGPVVTPHHKKIYHTSGLLTSRLLRATANAFVLKTGNSCQRLDSQRIGRSRELGGGHEAERFLPVNETITALDDGQDASI
jgi:hypothetical protein